MHCDLQCQLEGHENQNILGVCTDPDCQHKRPFCVGCKFQFHQTHQSQLRKFDDLINWINENNTITKNLEKLLEQLNEIVYSIKKSIETTQLCYNIQFHQMNYTTLDNTINNLINSWKSQNQIYNLVEQMMQASITQTTIQSIKASLNNQQNQIKQPENQIRQLIIQNNIQSYPFQKPQNNQFFIQNKIQNPIFQNNFQNQVNNNPQQFKQDDCKKIINFNQKEGQAQQFQIGTFQKQAVKEQLISQKIPMNSLLKQQFQN